MSHRLTIVSLFSVLLSGAVSGYYYEQQIEQQPYSGDGGAYQFSYETGGIGSNDVYQQQQLQSDAAQHFREESRDEYGNVIGKYGYVDPYGHLRVVKYRAGADGYFADGDTGVDQETIRQQRLLYAGDEATQIQNQAWQKATGSSSASAAASAAASASASGAYYGGGGSWVPAQRPATTTTTTTDWTTVDNSINQQYTRKGGSPTVVERLVAKSPPISFRSAYQQRQQQSVARFIRPMVTTYRSAPLKSAPYRSSSAAYIKSPVARLTEVQQTTSVVPANPVYHHHQSSSSSSAAAAASAAASAASSASAFGSAPYYGTKGGSAPYRTSNYRSARYSNGDAHARVQFKQFGPTPFQYSYAF